MLVLKNQSHIMALKSVTPPKPTKQQIPSSLSHIKVWENDKRTRRVTVHCSLHNFMPITELYLQNTHYIFKIIGAKGAQKVLKKMQIHGTSAQNTKTILSTVILNIDTVVDVNTKTTLYTVL